MCSLCHRLALNTADLCTILFVVQTIHFKDLMKIVTCEEHLLCVIASLALCINLLFSIYWVKLMVGLLNCVHC